MSNESFDEANSFQGYGEDILGAVERTESLLAEFDAMILLDAIADHLTAEAHSDDEVFQAQILEHAIKEIRKSRGLDT